MYLLLNLCYKVFLEIRQYAHNANQQNLQEFTNFINIILNYLEEDDQVKLIAPISIFSYALTEPHEIHLILMSLCLKYSNYKQARRFIERKQFQLNHKMKEQQLDIYINYFYCCGIVYTAYWEYEKALRYFQYLIQISQFHKYKEDINKWRLIKQFQSDGSNNYNYLQQLLTEQNSKDESTKDEIQDFVQVMEQTNKHISLCQHRMMKGPLQFFDNCSDFDLCRKDCRDWDLAQKFMIQREFLKKIYIKTLTGGTLDFNMLEFINSKLHLYKLHEEGQYLEFNELEPTVEQQMDQLLSYQGLVQNMMK